MNNLFPKSEAKFYSGYDIWPDNMGIIWRIIVYTCVGTIIDLSIDVEYVATRATHYSDVIKAR